MKLKNLFFLLAILLMFAWGILFFFTLKDRMGNPVLLHFKRKGNTPLCRRGSNNAQPYCSGLFLPQSGKTSGQYSQRNGFASRAGFQQPSCSCKTG